MNPQDVQKDAHAEISRFQRAFCGVVQGVLKYEGPFQFRKDRYGFARTGSLAYLRIRSALRCSGKLARGQIVFFTRRDGVRFTGL